LILGTLVVNIVAIVGAMFAVAKLLGLESRARRRPDSRRLGDDAGAPKR
jgi:hypothetical protein